MALTRIITSIIEDNTIQDSDISSSFATSISGSSTSLSSSVASDIAANLAARRSNTTISGSTTSLSSSVASDVAANLVSITNNSSSVASDVAANLVSITTNSSSFASRYTNQINQDLRTTASPTFVNTTVTGTLTAQEVHTEFESASILFTSGSTQFGNSSDDVHDFLGNTISGSATSTGSFGELHIDDKIGVGHSAPLAPIHISKDITQVESAATSRTNAGLYLNFDPTFGSNSLTIFAMSSSVATTATYGIQVGNSNASSAYPLSLQPFGGKVGIGVGNPGSNLVVSSSTKTDLLIGDNTSVFSDTGRGNVEINGHGSAVVGLTVDGAAKGLLLHDGTNSYFRNYANGQFQIYTNNTIRTTVSSSGQVGIGTTIPASATNVLLTVGSTGLGYAGMEFAAGTNAERWRLYTSYDDSNDAIFGIFRVSDSTYKFQVDENGAATFAGDVLVPEYIKHSGDTDTSLRFTDNTINFIAGNDTAMQLIDGSGIITHGATRATLTKGKSYSSGANVITFTVTVSNVSSWEPINFLVEANYTTANLGAQGYFYGWGHTYHYSASGLGGTSTGQGGASSNITVAVGNYSSNSFDITVTSATTSGDINMIASLDIRARHGISNITAA